MNQVIEEEPEDWLEVSEMGSQVVSASKANTNVLESEYLRQESFPLFGSKNPVVYTGGNNSSNQPELTEEWKEITNQMMRFKEEQRVYYDNLD